MSIYTPPSPDQYAVLEGVDYFRKPNLDRVPVYSDVHEWARCWSENEDADPRFLEADVAVLADAVLLALEHGYQKTVAKDWRNRKARVQPSIPPAHPVVGIP